MHGDQLNLVIISMSPVSQSKVIARQLSTYILVIVDRLWGDLLIFILSWATRQHC